MDLLGRFLQSLSFLKSNAALLQRLKDLWPEAPRSHACPLHLPPRPGCRGRHAAMALIALRKRQKASRRKQRPLLGASRLARVATEVSWRTSASTSRLTGPCNKTTAWKATDTTSAPVVFAAPRRAASLRRSWAEGDGVPPPGAGASSGPPAPGRGGLGPSGPLSPSLPAVASDGSEGLHSLASQWIRSQCLPFQHLAGN